MKLLASLLILGMILTSQCFAQEASPSKAGDVLASVGKHQITREMLDNIIATIPEENRVPFLTPDGRKKILDEVVSFMLFSEAARAQGIDKEPASKTRLEYIQDEYLARELFRRRVEKLPTVTEEEVAAYYKAHRAEFTPPEEVKARQIVVGTEAEANKIIEQIKAGKDFGELVKKFSISPEAARGGTLLLEDGRDWLPKGSFVNPFEGTLFKIATGQVGGPVKSQYGWHILKIEDRRQPDPRELVQVRFMIKSRLQDQKNAEIHKQLTDELKKTIPVVVK